MILRTRRSPIALAVDTTLTWLAWAGFFYLIGSGILSVLHDTAAAAASPESELLATIHTLLIYAAAALLTSAVLLAWARYNRTRYGGLRRRKPCQPLPDPRHALVFCDSPANLMQLWNCRVGIVHHDLDGMVVAVDTPAYRSPDRLVAARLPVQQPALIDGTGLAGAISTLALVPEQAVAVQFRAVDIAAHDVIAADADLAIADQHFGIAAGLPPDTVAGP
ncbi:poly-beta-1,6-N-acetyl-D-glucosamine biosynthesis protein PgaD [Bordetella petrii]|nr:poly-beta-1,6-N-acetyl-D-glucosamine biosynthesis protein PgaD [Bordetella petrii]